MASLGRGVEGSGERALVKRGVGLEAITIEQGPTLAKLPCWEAVQIPGRNVYGISGDTDHSSAFSDRS